MDERFQSKTAMTSPSLAALSAPKLLNGNGSYGSESGSPSTEHIFAEKVALQYRLYKGLLSELPFANLKTYQVMLALFTELVTKHTEKPLIVKPFVEAFLKRYLDGQTAHEQLGTLFKFIQFIERQVTLFDALEESAFTELVDVHGEGTLKHLLGRVTAEWKFKDLQTRLKTYKVRVVLTAHPTQFYPASVLRIIYELHVALKNNQLSAVHQLLMQLGRTPFRNKERPTPEAEAESILIYLRKVFYHVIPSIEATLVERLYQDAPAETAELPNIIELGFWPGGDRDGNPYVTAATTRTIARMLKRNILRCYLEDTRVLWKSFTFKKVYELLRIIEQRLVLSYRAVASDRADFFTSEVAAVSDKLFPYATVDALIADVKAVHEIVVREHGGLFSEKLTIFIRKLRAFGFHFATIDIRQNRSVHHQCVTELLKRHVPAAAAYATATETQQITMLLAAWEQFSQPLNKQKEQQPAAAGASPELKQLLLSLETVMQVQAANGEKGLNRYIISNTESALDVLELLFLFHVIGLRGKALRVDIVPLFETINVLKRAGIIMEQLYKLPRYREHLAQRTKRQLVMLGYSDGTKDGGYLAANWGIFCAKELMSAGAERAGVQVVFFDGRGGPPARGGGESNLFYRALSAKMAAHELQLTVQGQTISSNFATVTRGRYNLEQLLTAGLENRLFLQQQATLNPKARRLLAAMSEFALKKYEALKGHPKFIPYLEQVTPLRFFRYSNVGSRPTKRSSKEGINLTNLRAIPFVASWNQLKQNVPAYYGFGSALAFMIEREGKLAELKELYQNSIFFRALVGNTMQALLKTDFSFTVHLQDDAEFSEIWRLARDEAELTKRLLLKISGQRELLADLPLNRESIRFRESIVRPLLIIQQYALQCLRSTKELDAVRKASLEKLVIRSLVGSLNASRNSA